MAGGPILRGGKIGPGIYVEDADNPGHMLQIPQLSAHTAHKTLGHFLSPAGTNKKQLMVLKGKSDEIATILMASGLSRSETWTYYFSTYLPSVWCYSLPMHHFGRTKLNQVQSKALNCIIARCGFNRQHTGQLSLDPPDMGEPTFDISTLCKELAKSMSSFGTGAHPPAHRRGNYCVSAWHGCKSRQELASRSSKMSTPPSYTLIPSG